MVFSDREGERPLSGDALPVGIGGVDADLVLPGVHSNTALAFVGASEDGIFLQPSPDAVGRVSCNGMPLSASQWLHGGDVVRLDDGILEVRTEGGRVLLEARDPTTENPTEPPETAAQDIPHQPTTVQPIEFRPASATRGHRRGIRVRPKLVLEIALLASLALGAFLVLTATSVLVEIEPQPESISFRGGLPALNIGGRYLLRPGSYTLIADREGYQRLEVPVEITKESRQKLRFELELEPGTLDVKSGDIVGAEILIDGEVVGTTPLSGIRVTAGDHLVTVRADRFREYTTRITIDEPGSFVEIDAELVPDFAAVTFRSDPPGAAVVVDGKRIGTTPLTADVASGRHVVELRLTDHKPHIGRLDVAADQAQTLPVVRLEKSDGNLVVQSDPSGATVVLDGTFQGQTPLDLAVAPDAKLRLKVSKAGYVTYETELRLPSGARRTVDVTLAPEYGELEVKSRPPGAELYIDGKLEGTTPTTLQLTAAAHAIELRKEGYESHRTTLTPNPGLTQTLNVTMQTPEELAALPPVVTSPQGVELRLVEGGRFQTGASRREPGRRANETIRQVEITRRFYLAVREVSNRDFREFKKDHQSGGAGESNLEIDHHPVVRVTWEEAAKYCNWLSEKQGLPQVYVVRAGSVTPRNPLPIGYRLPTEAEWVWAARFVGSGVPRKYAWGNSLPIPEGAGNYGDGSARGMLGSALPDYHDGHAATAPVGSFEPNPLGLYNLGGNVSEWMHDRYTIYTPGAGEVARDPEGPTEGEYHVIRGGSWMDESVTELRLSYRDYGDERRPDVGFRIARSAE